MEGLLFSSLILGTVGTLISAIGGLLVGIHQERRKVKEEKDIKEKKQIELTLTIDDGTSNRVIKSNSPDDLEKVLRSLEEHQLDGKVLT